MPGRPVPRSDEHGHDLVFRGTRAFPLCALALVRLRTAEIGPINLDIDLFKRDILGDGEKRLGAVLARLAQAVTKKPCAFMRHAEIAAQVTRGVPD